MIHNVILIILIAIYIENLYTYVLPKHHAYEEVEEKIINSFIQFSGYDGKYSGKIGNFNIMSVYLFFKLLISRYLLCS